MRARHLQIINKPECTGVAQALLVMISQEKDKAQLLRQRLVSYLYAASGINHLGRNVRTDGRITRSIRLRNALSYMREYDGRATAVRSAALRSLCVPVSFDFGGPEA